MKTKLAALILFFLLFQNNATYTNNEDLEKKKEIIELSTKLDELKKITEINIQKDVKSKEIIDAFGIKSSFSLEAREKVRNIADTLGVNEEAIYRLFYHECRGNHKAVNKVTGASGFLGFMPSTAKSLGTSVEQIREMTVEQQLDLVEKYLLRTTKDKHFTSFHNLYLAVLYPYAINKSKDYVLGSEKSMEYAKNLANKNKGIDKAGNNDGLVSIADVIAWLS